MGGGGGGGSVTAGGGFTASGGGGGGWEDPLEWRLPLAARYLGQHVLKGVSEPMDLWHCRCEEERGWESGERGEGGRGLGKWVGEVGLRQWEQGKKSMGKRGAQRGRHPWATTRREGRSAGRGA